MSDSARIIVTYKCNRKCPGCANTYSSIMSKAQPLRNVKQLEGYKNLVISGGEPMLFPDRVMKLAKVLHKAAPQAKVYLYTAYNKNNADIERVLPYLDGINYTVHTDSEGDLAEFQSFQALASRWKDKGFRLYVEPQVADKLHIIPSVWERVKSSAWMSEDDMIKAGGCPEDLFVLTKTDRPKSSSDIKNAEKEKDKEPSKRPETEPEKEPLTEGIIKIPDEQKAKLKDFYGSLKSQVNALKKNGMIPLFEMMRVVKSFEDMDISANPRARLIVKFYYDYSSETVGGLVWADYRNAVMVMNIPAYIRVAKVENPDDIVKYGQVVVEKILWPEVLNTLVHETVHFLQQMSGGPDKTPVTLATPRKSYFRNPFEQQAWALSYLEKTKEQLGNADPIMILKSLRQHGVIDDMDLAELKTKNPKAWKGVMKQAIMSAMAELEDTGKLPWQKDTKLP